MAERGGQPGGGRANPYHAARVVAGHLRVWDGGNKNHDEPCVEKGKGTPGKEKKGKAKVIGPWDLSDDEEIQLTKRFEVDNQEINCANRELVKLMNDLRKCRNQYIETSLNAKCKDRTKLINLHLKNFNNLRSKVPEKVAAVEALNGNAVPYPPHLRKLPKQEDLPSSSSRSSA
ncbi:hypothetical protein ACP70R_014259 [Stipagrostis hirtigluma subsp. patula]